MEVRAVAKYIRVQPRKVRIIADEVRGKNAAYSAAQLRFHTSKSAKALHKVLISAMANAEENHGLDRDSLRIAIVKVDEGPRLKRIRARAQGRANRILKKTSHITVVVEDVEPTKAVKAHGTKAKPRPTLSAPAKGGKKAAAKPVEAVVEAPKEEAIEEATPVTASEAPEETGSTAPVETTNEAIEATTDEATTEEGASDDKGAQ